MALLQLATTIQSLSLSLSLSPPPPPLSPSLSSSLPLSLALFLPLSLPLSPSPSLLFQFVICLQPTDIRVATKIIQHSIVLGLLI